MPAHSVRFKNNVLDGLVGTTRGSNAPDSWRIRLWHDRPDTIGAQEADFGGYAAVVRDSDDWTAAAGAEKDTSSLVNFGVPTTDGTDAIRYWALHHVDDNELAFSAPLERELTVTEGSIPVLIRPTVTYP